MESQPQYTNVESLKNKYDELTHAGRFIESLEVMDEAIVALSRSKQNPEELEACTNKLAQALNASAMIYLEAADYENCYALLKRAEGLDIRNPRIRSTTLNNLGCYYRKTNKLSTALMYLQKSLEMETRAKTSKNLSDTYVNICAVLSSLSMHGEALHSAMLSVIIQQHELIQQMAKQADRASSIKPDRLSVLALGYYNMAVQFEHLKETNQARYFYDKSIHITAELNNTNTKLLANLQTAKKKFEISLRRPPTEQSYSSANLKKTGHHFRSRAERIRTEITKDNFYKHLEANMKGSEAEEAHQSTDAKGDKQRNFRISNRYSHDWSSTSHPSVQLGMRNRPALPGKEIQLKLSQAKTTRLQHRVE